MQVTLSMEELEQAVLQYLKNQGIPLNNKKKVITFHENRRTNAGVHTATITITPDYDKSSETTGTVPVFNIGDKLD